MDFSVISQLRAKKFWWLDVMLYFAVSLLIAAGFCYFVFSVKSGMIKKQISDAASSLDTVGTQEQKAQEKQVNDYIKKINDFNNLFKNHKFVSNGFAFMQNETMPYIWFKQFGLDQKGASIQLSGQADNMDNFSRQVANFEKSKYVKKVGMLNSTVGSDGKISFSVNLTLDPKIFTYIADLSLIVQKNEKNQQSQAPQITAEVTADAVKEPAKSNQKMITVQENTATVSFMPTPAKQSQPKTFIILAVVIFSAIIILAIIAIIVFKKLNAN